MENISKHITYNEAIKSNTALILGINNEPNETELKKMVLLANNVFEPLRKWYGKPILISSFFRSERLNSKILGSKNSQHTKGEAMDIQDFKAKSENAKLFFYIKDNLDFDQLIWEFGNDKNPSWVHVSYSGTKNRKQVLRAVKNNGKTKYINFL